MSVIKNFPNYLLKKKNNFKPNCQRISFFLFLKWLSYIWWMVCKLKSDKILSNIIDICWLDDNASPFCRQTMSMWPIPGTCGVDNVCTLFPVHISTILSDTNKDMTTTTASFGQAPLRTAGTSAMVLFMWMMQLLVATVQVWQFYICSKRHYHQKSLTCRPPYHCQSSCPLQLCTSLESHQCHSPSLSWQEGRWWQKGRWWRLHWALPGPDKDTKYHILPCHPPSYPLILYPLALVSFFYRTHPSPKTKHG